MSVYSGWILNIGREGVPKTHRVSPPIPHFSNNSSLTLFLERARTAKQIRFSAEVLADSHLFLLRNEHSCSLSSTTDDLPVHNPTSVSNQETLSKTMSEVSHFPIQSRTLESMEILITCN